MRAFLSPEAYDDRRSRKGFCDFGLTEIALPMIVGLLTSAGVGATTAAAIGSVAAPALVSAGVGAASSAAMGGDPGQGAMFGALSGGLGGAAGLGSGAASGAAGGTGLAAGPAAGAAADGIVSGAPSAASGALTPLVSGDVMKAAARALPEMLSHGALSASIPSSSGQGALGQMITTPGGNVSMPDIGVEPAQAGGSPLAQVAGQLSGGNSGTQGILAMLAGLAQNQNRPSTTAPQSATANDPLRTTGYLNRTPSGAQPATGSYYTYGQAPEPQFFTGNQLHFAHGGALSRAIAGRKMAGGGEFSTGGGNNYVGGDGAGQEDNVPARLSPGEYVIDASTLSRLGDGNSEEGARKMDHFRHLVASDSGARQVVQNKTRSPGEYLQKVA